MGSKQNKNETGRKKTKFQNKTKQNENLLPTCLRYQSRSKLETLCPSSSTRPCCGLCTRWSSCRTVLLPQPLPPTSATDQRAGIDRERASSTGRGTLPLPLPPLAAAAAASAAAFLAASGYLKVTSRSSIAPSTDGRMKPPRGEGGSLLLLSKF